MRRYLFICAFITCFLPSASALTWAFGWYTGDGVDGLTISGLSFSPDIVIIKGAGATAAYIKTSSLGGTSSKNLSATGAYSSTAIKSLTSDGFTVGTNSAVNTNSTTYYFMAIDAGSDAVVGSYAGNGGISKAITGFGFRPEMVLVYSNNALYGPGYLTDAMPADKSARFGAMGIWGFFVKSLDADGFTANSSYNYSGTTYYYVGLNSPSSAALRTGSYTGSAGDKNVAIAGTTPEAVFICNQDNVNAYPIQKFACMPTTHSSLFTATAPSTTDITAFAAGSFTVKAGSKAANNTSWTNYYIAFGSGEALPIELQEYQVICQPSGGAKLRWVTATETNNDYFTIERSDDGTNYQAIKTIKGSGTSNSPLEYMTTDDYVTDHTIYYRLRQTDYDGKSKIYGTKPLYPCHTHSGMNVHLYPNPAHDELNCGFVLDKNETVTVDIKNMLGQVVHSEVVEGTEGSNMVTLDMSHYADGVYVFQLRGIQKSYETKLVKH
ncbi:MAG: T9SS type A sorting domain-containing protein [Flavobacteriales bacterium]|nr:T9SS type A sorting domain-containing protein [Flavobacteriales bacterium]MCB9447984.1 T9SS type A sorting domain-containing protein [Flavobacteriales bacterium]